MVDLFEGIEMKKSTPSVCFNTDTMFDLQVGGAQRGRDGLWYLNGGLGPSIAGIHSFGGMYKSTLAGSLGFRVASIYQSKAIVADSEDAISRDKARMARMAGYHSITIDESPNNQVACLDCKVEYDIDGLFKFLRELGEKKLKHHKEFMITTPFIDLSTGEFVKVLAPTPVLVDSLTEMHSNDELVQVEVGIDDKKTKTVYMIDANKKTLFLRWMNKMCAEYGYACICTAHYGEQLNLDSYGPTPKQLQYLKQGYKVKGVGSKFTFLTSPQCQVVSAKVLEDDKHESWYKFGNTPPTDVNEIGVLIQRCKNNVAGSTFTYVVSQMNGLLTDVTDYHYLRTNKMYGMTGSLQSQQLVLYPEKSMGRNTIRGIAAEDPKLRRALQLTAQLYYIQNNWNAETMPFEIKMTPERLMEILASDKNTYTVDRILNSRSYWLPEEIKSEQEYLSIFDVLEFCSKVSVK